LKKVGAPKGIPSELLKQQQPRSRSMDYISGRVEDEIKTLALQ